MPQQLSTMVWTGQSIKVILVSGDIHGTTFQSPKLVGITMVPLYLKALILLKLLIPLPKTSVPTRTSFPSLAVHGKPIKC